MRAGVIVFLILSVLMYAAFRPFTDRLLLRILLGVLSFGVLGAVFRAALRAEPASSIPLNFVVASLWIAVAFSVVHYIDNWLQSHRT
jgi:hypothetical protein